MNVTQLLFILLMITLYTGQNFFCKKFSFSYKGDESDATPVLTIWGGIIVAAVSFAFSGFVFKASTLTLLFGIINAIVLYGYNYFLIKASAAGPYSVLIVFTIVGGIGMPSIAKWIGFGKIMSGPAICFLFLILLSVYLMSIKPNDENREKLDRISPVFIIYSMCLALCNGTYCTILAIQQEITGESEKEELIIVTFLAAAIISLITLAVKKANVKQAMKQTKRSLVHLLLYAFCAAFAVNSLVIILLLEIDTGVLYTVQNAGVMLMSVVLSLICFKEKLTKVNVIGCIIMTASLVGIMVFAETSFSQLWDIILKHTA